MKNMSPREISFIISLVFSLIVMVGYSLGIAITGEMFNLPLVCITFLFSLVVGYFVINFFITKFIYDKIRLIYRTIKTQKFDKKEKLPFSPNEDVLGRVTQEVKEWATEKKGQIKELKLKENFQKEFIGNVSHELKTPIFSIQGYILTLLEGGLEDENINRKYLLRAEKSTERMIDLVDDLEQINRYDNQRTDLLLEKANIVNLVKEIFESLEIKAKEASINLKFTKEDSSAIFVACDKKKISQVLTNLIVNSIKYGKKEGTTEVRFYEMDKTISIEVSDNGLGIEEKDLSRIFERFYRVERSRSRDQGGSGLGLAIVKKIVELHGQAINVRSTINVGSTFSFTLKKVT